MEKEVYCLKTTDSFQGLDCEDCFCQTNCSSIFSYSNLHKLLKRTKKIPVHHLYVPHGWDFQQDCNKHGMFIGIKSTELNYVAFKKSFSGLPIWSICIILVTAFIHSVNNAGSSMLQKKLNLTINTYSFERERTQWVISFVNGFIGSLSKRRKTKQMQLCLCC